MVERLVQHCKMDCRRYLGFANWGANGQPVIQQALIDVNMLLLLTGLLLVIGIVFQLGRVMARAINNVPPAPQACEGS